MINRIGDVALSVAVYLFFISFNTTSLTLSTSSESHVYTFLAVALLLASMAKSAQLGFNTWLPDAMEGKI